MTVTDLSPVLLSLTGKRVSTATAINSRGQVVGRVFDPRWDGLDGFIWDRGSATIIPGFSPRGINARGEVVGSVTYRPAVWEPAGSSGQGEIIKLWPSDSIWGEVTAINDAGDIVGWYGTSLVDRHAFVAIRQ